MKRRKIIKRRKRKRKKKEVDRRLGKSLQPHPSLMGWGFCVRQKNIGFEDRITDEYKALVTEF